MKYNFLLHLHPKKIRSGSIRLNLTFGLGGIASLLFLIQLFTGLLLKYHYVPTPSGAYDSILHIENNLIFGQLTRNIHHWAAILMIWTTFLHLLRVIFTGAYNKPRHTSWISGLFMLVFVILFNFTGYLLPWDQLSYWAVTIAANIINYIPFAGDYLYRTILGGSEINEITLYNFYNLHTGFLPFIMIALVSWHIWQVRRSGGVIQSQSDSESELIKTNPHLIKKEFVAALTVIAFLLIISIFFNAPLLDYANPLKSPNPAKAPWYFIGFQEILLHFNPVVAITIIPAILTAFFIWIPFSKTNKTSSGIWFGSDHGKKTAIKTSLISLSCALLFIVTSEFMNKSKLPGYIPQGIILTLFFGIIFYMYLKKQKLNRTEQIQSIFIILTITYTVFTITGIFFRGEGMEIVFP